MAAKAVLRPVWREPPSDSSGGLGFRLIVRKASTVVGIGVTSRVGQEDLERNEPNSGG